MRHLTAADYHVMPWKNGLGATMQMAIEPPGARFPDTPFLWRLSSAPVAADGPFSVFAGYDRLLTIWHGAGLLLNGEPLLPGEVARFAGDRATHGALIDGPVRDFGVIFARDRLRARLTVQDVCGAVELLADEEWLTCLVCADPPGSDALTVDGAPVRPDDMVWLAPGSQVTLRSAMRSRVFVVALQMREQAPRSGSEVRRDET